MDPNKEDRRVNRTRISLQLALKELISERGYDGVTIQDITERANVGRTTFYLHFQSKDDLFLSSMADFVTEFSFGMHSAADWLADQPTQELVDFFTDAKKYKKTRSPINNQHQGTILMNTMNRVMAQKIQESLKLSFPDTSFKTPLPVLAQAMGGAHVWLVIWWLEEHSGAYSAKEVAKMSHRLLQAMLRSALDQEL